MIITDQEVIMIQNDHLKIITDQEVINYQDDH